MITPQWNPSRMDVISHSTYHNQMIVAIDGQCDYMCVWSGLTRSHTILNSGSMLGQHLWCWTSIKPLLSHRQDHARLGVAVTRLVMRRSNWVVAPWQFPHSPPSSQGQKGNACFPREVSGSFYGQCVNVRETDFTAFVATHQLEWMQSLSGVLSNHTACTTV